MREIVNYAFLTDQEVTITMKNGDVFTNKRIEDYDECIIITQDGWILQWSGVHSITLS